MSQVLTQKKFYKDIKLHFSLSCQDTTLFQVSSKLWQLTILSSIALLSPELFLIIPYLLPQDDLIHIHEFNCHQYADCQNPYLQHKPHSKFPIHILKPLLLYYRHVKVNMFQIYYCYSLYLTFPFHKRLLRGPKRAKGLPQLTQLLWREPNSLGVLGSSPSLFPLQNCLWFVSRHPILLLAKRSLTWSHKIAWGVFKNNSAWHPPPGIQI